MQIIIPNIRTCHVLFVVIVHSYVYRCCHECKVSRTSVCAHVYCVPEVNQCLNNIYR